MRQGYGSQSNLSGWRFSVGSVPLNERRSGEGNGEKVRALQGVRGEEMCAGKMAMGWGRGESFSPASSSPYLSPALLLCAALHYLNA